ncbi:hypothetical protein [Corynebacterium deserti]|uniref:hypothetical protein n=1 Tax=Corynebacterium deserti TaxID=1408191 RepID=UPI0006AD1C67|nr:hypothetical protein [Corynebacterium deserti]
MRGFVAGRWPEDQVARISAEMMFQENQEAEGSLHGATGLFAEVRVDTVPAPAVSGMAPYRPLLPS